MSYKESLIQSLRNSTNSADLIDKIGEVAIDSLLDNGILRDIPIIGTAISLFRAGNEIAANIFAKKIAIFLSEVEKISIEDREKFFLGLPLDNEEDDLGETLLLILDKVDNYLLARMLGRAFRLLAGGDLAKSTYEIYIHAIKQLNPYLIRQLKQFYEHENFSGIDYPAAVALANYGLAKIVVLPTMNKNTQQINTFPEKTVFGQSFFDKIIRET